MDGGLRCGGRANDAFYRLQVLRSRHYAWPLRVVDFVFYRGVAGYLVRPIHPLLVLLGLVLLAALLRMLQSAKRARPVGRVRTLAVYAGRYTGHVYGTATAAFKRSATEPLWPGEVLVYRILLACALIGLYANQTIRQLVDLLL
jgi:hypothetical protein